MRCGRLRSILFRLESFRNIAENCRQLISSIIATFFLFLCFHTILLCISRQKLFPVKYHVIVRCKTFQVVRLDVLSNLKGRAVFCAVEYFFAPRFGSRVILEFFSFPHSLKTNSGDVSENKPVSLSSIFLKL